MSSVAADIATLERPQISRGWPRKRDRRPCAHGPVDPARRSRC